jgi:uncharacterized membrane protein YdjX (TVP38/TMEM64 family)
MGERFERLRRWLGNVRVFESAEQRRRVALHAVIALVVLGATVVLLRDWLRLLADAPALRALVAGYGMWAPAVFVALQALQVVFAPIPGQVLAVTAGYLFGTWWGTLYNMVGVTLGSAAAFWLARRFGRSYVEGVVDADLLARFDAASDEYARSVLFVLFLVPGLPDDLLCFAGGLTRVPLWQLVAIAVIGRLPGFLLANAVGDLAGTGQLGAAALLAVLVLAASVLGYLHRDRLFALFQDS